METKAEGKSAASLLLAALTHLKDARTPTGCVHAVLLSVCGQVEDARARDDLARSVYQAADVWCV